MVMAEGNSNGWTFDTLYIHVMEISKAAKEGVNAAMASAEKAILKAETATEKRFDSVNEFRQAMRDQQENFANKSETNMRLEDLAKRLDRVTSGMEIASGRSSGVVTVAILAGWMITTAVALIAIFWRH
jgi:choline dehydrogenase-like flavoprotein